MCLRKLFHRMNNTTDATESTTESEELTKKECSIPFSDKPRETITITNPMCEEEYKYPIGFNENQIVSFVYSDDEGDITLKNGEGAECFIAGKPVKSRNWWIDVELSEKVVRYSCFINDNPRLMWKDIPSDQQVKPDKYYRALQTPEVDLVGVSHRGRSHANKGTYRDDDFYINRVDGFCISVVADGAGSAELSSIGSKIFCKAVGEFLTKKLVEKKNSLIEMLNDVKGQPHTQLFRPDFASCLYEIIPSSALYGRKQLQLLAEENGVPLKKYNTTALITISLSLNDGCFFCATFQVGDGATVVLTDDRTELMGKPDKGSAPGETLFVTSNGVFDNATEIMKRLNVCFTDTAPTIISMTDGITDSYFKEGQGVNDMERWRQLINDIQTPDGTLIPANELCDWLNYYVSQEHDDRTMTIVKYK